MSPDPTLRPWVVQVPERLGLPAVIVLTDLRTGRQHAETDGDAWAITEPGDYGFRSEEAARLFATRVRALHGHDACTSPARL